MTTQDNLAVAAAASVDGGRWLAHLDDLMDRIAGRFGRVEPRRRARQLVLGLLSDLPRKNCWTIAEHAGDRSPDGLQHLLAEARWDHDGVRDDLRDYVVAGLGVENAVLVVDETGDLKKGSHTVGVQRQYTGTAGRVENAQVAVYAVYLAYATDAGHAFIDRELYLPRCWADDRERSAWQQLSAGNGAKGPRRYDWALVDIDTDQLGHRWLLVRRNPSTGELAYYRCYSPHPEPLATLVKVAGRRWTVEEGFQTGKELCGLDEHQVRRWVSWHRWTILAMAAHAYLAIFAARERSTRTDHDDQIPIT